MKDVTALQSKEYADIIKAVVPSVNATGTIAEFDGASTTPDRTVGTTGDMVESGSWTVRSGRFFNADDTPAAGTAGGGNRAPLDAKTQAAVDACQKELGTNG